MSAAVNAPTTSKPSQSQTLFDEHLKELAHLSNRFHNLFFALFF
jgi:hypothetical protein